MVAESIAVLGVLAGIYKHWREGKANEKRARAQEAIAVLAASIENTPMDDESRQRLKGSIQALADANDLEDDDIYPIVDEISTILKRLHHPNGNYAEIQARAVQIWKDKRRTKTSSVPAFSLAFALILLTSCAPVVPVLEADGLATVVWPKGTELEDVDTIQHPDGTVTTTAPIDPEKGF